MPIHRTPQGSFEYLQWGTGKRCIVLIHGSASSPRALTPLATALAGEGQRVVAPALAGYASTRVDAALGPRRANGTIVRALVDASSTPCVLFGHSMGGLAALDVALDGADVAGLVLYEPIVTGLLERSDPSQRAGLEWDRGIVAALAEAVEAGDRERGVASFIEAWSGGDWRAMPESARQRLVADAERLAVETHATSHAPLDCVRLEALRTPLLVLHGTASPEVARTMARRLRESVCDARLQVLEGCGHMAPVTAAEVVAPPIRAFLRARWAA